MPYVTPMNRRRRRGEQTDLQRHSTAMQDAREHVAAERIGAQPVRDAGFVAFSSRSCSILRRTARVRPDTAQNHEHDEKPKRPRDSNAAA
jgi:hypothetical protein